MKRIWWLIFFLPLWTEASSRVALIGNDKLVGEITAVVSRDPEFDLLERLEMAAIQDEQQLLTTLQADSLRTDVPHADLIAAIRMDRIIIFNARNGFVLIHAETAARPEDIPAQTLELLRQAAVKANRSDGIRLALGAVRSTGLIPRDKYRAAAITTRMLRQLANSDTIQLLERDWLGAVLDERELSGMQFSLSTADRILELEFLPGTEPETIDLILTLTDAGGNKLWSQRYSAITDVPIPVGDVCSRLDASPGAALSHPAEEARRLSEEYRIRKLLLQLPSNFTPPEWENLRPLVQTMRALAPDNPDYQRELILYEARHVYRQDLSAKEIIQIFERFIADTEKFYQDHPDYLSKGGKPLLAAFPGCFPTASAVSPLSSAQKTQMFRTLRTLRLYENQNSDTYGRVNENNIKTAVDFTHYQLLFRDATRPESYFDLDEMMRENYLIQLKLYRCLRDLLRKAPEQRAQIDWMPIFPANSLPSDNPVVRHAVAKELQTILTEDTEIAPLVREINLPSVTAHYYAIEAMRDYLNSDRSMTALQRITFAMFEKLEALGYTITPNETFGIGFAVYLVSFAQLSELNNLPRAYLAQKSGTENDERSMIDDLYDGSYIHKLSDLRRHAPELQSLAYPNTCDSETRRMWNRVAEYLWGPGPQEPEAAAARDALNSAWDIESVTLPGECKGAVEADGRIFVLISASSDDPLNNSTSLELYEYTGQGTPLRHLPSPGLAGDAFRTPTERFPSFHATADYLLAGGNGLLAVFDRRRESWNILHDLPGNFIVSTAVHNGRIYYLTGSLGATPGMYTLCGMYSCRPDGGDRRIHFSGDRLHPEQEPDRMTQAKLTRLIPLPDGRLLFGINTYNTPLRLYVFAPETETFSRAADLPVSWDFSLRDQGGFILGAIRDNDGKRYFRLDPTTLRPEWLSLPQPPRFTAGSPPEWQINDPQFLSGTWLIDAGFEGVVILRTDAPEQTPMLLLPNPAFLAVESPSGWNIVTGNRIFQVKPHTSGN